MSVVVIGPANLEFVLQVPTMPKFAEGESVRAVDLSTRVGGSGAIQALAAARLGARVFFVGCIGNDEDGIHLLHGLREGQVDASEVEILSSETTGVGLVCLGDDGGRSLVVYAGANQFITPSRVMRTMVRLTSSRDIVILGASTSVEVLTAALTTAKDNLARTILHLSYPVNIGHELNEFCDFLVLDEFTASAYTGVTTQITEPETPALDVLLRQVKSAVILTASGGVVWADDNSRGFCPPEGRMENVDPVRSTDVFIGSLAAFLDAGASLEEAVSHALLSKAQTVAEDADQTDVPELEDSVRRNVYADDDTTNLALAAA